MKEKLFSVTLKDFDMQTFRAGGKGGQKQNKTNSGVRFIHRASGARGESREMASQSQNKKIAWKRCIDTPEFKKWLQLETLRSSGKAALEEAEIARRVKQALRPSNLLVEQIEDGEWVPSS